MKNLKNFDFRNDTYVIIGNVEIPVLILSKPAKVYQPSEVVSECLTILRNVPKFSDYNFAYSNASYDGRFYEDISISKFDGRRSCSVGVIWFYEHRRPVLSYNPAESVLSQIVEYVDLEVTDDY
jgi:hypothetical protein